MARTRTRTHTHTHTHLFKLEASLTGMLPVLYEDDKQLVESSAIARYLAKKFGM